MDTKIQKLAQKLGAEVVGIVPEYSAGAFGVAKVEQAFRERLERERTLRSDRATQDAQGYADQLRREWNGRP